MEEAKGFVFVAQPQKKLSHARVGLVILGRLAQSVVFSRSHIVSFNYSIHLGV